MSVQAFYDELAPLYHLIFENWEASVARQGRGLASLIREHWGASACTVHDAAVGIGTQALGLLALGFRVTGSDLSRAAVHRARREAAARHVPLSCVVADFRALPLRAASADVVIVCDNALPFVDGDLEIRFYAPKGYDPQPPHNRDEIYIVAAGHGRFRVGDRVDPISPGALLYVAAHEVHRFEDFSEDLAVWVVFYGPLK